MAFDTPTLDEEVEFQAAHMRHLFPTADVSEGSPNWLFLKTIAAGVTGNHAHIEAVKNDVMPDTSLGTELGRWGVIKGVAKKGATPARKSKALRVVGTPGTAVPNTRAMFHPPTGLKFQTANADVVGAGGSVDMDVVGVDVGSQTRLSAGETLQFTVPIAGLEETAELQLALDQDGDDAELDGDYRARVLARFSSPLAGNRADDYIAWALAVTGIATAFDYPLRGGVGTNDLAALHKGSGGVRCLSDGEVASLQAVIDALRPVGMKAFRVLKVTAIVAPPDVEVTIIPDGALEHEFDWDDTTPPTVLAWTALTRTLQFAAARPSSMQAGHRLTIDPVAGGGTGKERVIESLSGADTVILENDPAGDTPAATDTIYAGGPLVEPTRQSIQALADGFGPANPDAKRYGPWEGNLRPNAVSRVATAVAGVLDGTVIAPVATVVANDPAYPDDQTVELIILGHILVRKQH